MLAEGQPGCEVAFLAGPAQVPEASGLGHPDGVVSQVGQRLVPPKRESLAGEVGGPVQVLGVERLDTRLQQPLEAGYVDVVGRGRQAVAARDRLDPAVRASCRRRRWI